MSIVEFDDFVKKIFNLLENHMGKNTEIVFHDLTKPYDHTIVDIRNGEITGRTIGGCGSNLGLEVISGVVKDGDRFNYITHTKDGKVLRSSSIYLRDNDKVVGSICINTDITDTVRFEQYLKEYNKYEMSGNGEENTEHFANNVSELLDGLIMEAQRYVGKAEPLMSKEDKLQFLSYLDKRGAFLISKSSEQVCKFLNISKVTFYNYLEAVRNNSNEIT